jgi:hypothetical protein
MERIPQHHKRYWEPVYWHLPRRFRKILMRLRLWGYALSRLYEGLRPSVVWLSGMERSSGKELCVAVAGPQATRAWFSALAFADSPDCRSRGRIWIWRVLPVIQSTAPSCGLAVIQSSPVFEVGARLANAFRIPLWIELVLDITPEGLRKKRSRFSDVARLIGKNRLSFIFAESEKDFQHFYYRMYKPYIRGRHGKSAVQISYNWLKEEWLGGKLIFIRMDNRPVAGCVVRKVGNQPGITKLGVLDGDFGYVRSGCIGAMVYFVGNYLQSQGYKTMNMGFSRPFLTDGPLHSKKLFGASIKDTRPYKTREILYLKPLKHNRAVHDFLAANPFVCFTDARKPQVAVFSEMPGSGMQVSYSDFHTTTWWGAAGKK